jgi:8-amino-7-oxononanoate synthase
MQNMVDRLTARLSQRQAESRLRKLTPAEPDASMVTIDGRQLINFAGNDYLGLARHPALIERSIAFTRRYGAGSTASRLIAGNISPYQEIERKLALLKGTEDALIFATGYQTNQTVLPALIEPRANVFTDRLSHNSLLSGVLASEGRMVRYAHNDLVDLGSRLASAEGGKWIVTESVFSMDGDRLDVAAIADLARSNDACLFIDEAHAGGVLGQNGMGLTAGRKDVTVAMGTFGKAFGCFGAYIAGCRQLKEYLVNFCAGLIYSTALPPAVLGAIDAALDIVPTMDREREFLLDQADYVRAALKRMGFDTGQSSTQIIPIIIGAEQEALALSWHLEANGIFASAIRPPTVPDGASRIRISLSASHSREQIDVLLNAMERWHAH